MTSKRIAQTNQQQKSEKPQESGILQRAAVRSVSGAQVQSTDAKEAQPLGNSALSKDFSRVPISTTKPQQIMAKLMIGPAGDKYEQEADRVAAQVVQRINAPASVRSSEDETVQREEMETKDNEPRLMRSPIVQRKSSNGGMAATPDLEASINRARGGGQPLADNIRKPMEQVFGADFSGVKVHTDAQSDQLNRSIQARAFTTGQNVFFRQGAYKPGNRGGQELIAHELTHVVQQSGEAVQQSKLQKTGQVLQTATSATLPQIQCKANWETVGQNLVSDGRFEFASDIQKALKTKAGEHRCHIISYENITSQAIDPINEAIQNKWPIKDVLGKLEGLIASIFPGKDKSTRHPHLTHLAAKYYNNANKALDQIESAGGSSGQPNWAEVKNGVNNLIEACNNSVDNLRQGEGTTNSSIGGAIDPPSSKEEELKSGTLIWLDTQGLKKQPLDSERKVLRLQDKVAEEQLRTNLGSTFAQPNEMTAFSSGSTVQSSTAGRTMTSGTMTSSNPVPIAIEMKQNEFYLFKPQ